MRPDARESAEGKPIRPKRRGCCGCLGVLGGALVVLALLVLGTYLRNNHGDTIAIPPPPPRPPGDTYPLFVKAAQMAVGMKHKSPLSMDVPPAMARTPANYAACAAEYQRIRKALRQALKGPCGGRTYRTNEDVVPELGAFRELGRAIAGAAGHCILTHEYDEAVDTRLDGIEMARMLEHGSALLPVLSFMATEAICSSGIEPRIPLMSAPGLKHEADRLAHIEAVTTPYYQIAEEHADADTASLQDAIRNARSLRAQWEFGTSLGGPDWMPDAVRDKWQAARYTLGAKAAWIRDSYTYLHAVSEEARGPYTGRSNVPVPRNPLAELLPDMDFARRKYEACIAVTRLLAIEVALYRYRKDHGRFPDSLSALGPRYLEWTPTDPFGGGANVPFRYRAIQGGRAFVLYSVGPDMKDDGGKATRYPGDQNGGDIVAGRIWARTGL